MEDHIMPVAEIRNEGIGLAANYQPKLTRFDRNQILQHLGTIGIPPQNYTFRVAKDSGYGGTGAMKFVTKVKTNSIPWPD